MSKLTMFPAPYNDELVCSIGARYAELRNLSSSYGAVESFYGSSPPKINVFFPTGLDNLTLRLPPNHAYTSDQFITKNSLVPYHKPFLPPDRVQEIEQRMKSRSSAPAFTLTSSISCGIEQASEFMYCPDCAEEERKKYHHCYFHRLPHAPGVFVCPKHGVWLETTGISTKARFEFVIAEQVVPIAPARPIDRDNIQHLDLLAIATNTLWLLENNLPAGSYNRLRANYVELLSRKGLASLTGHVFSKKLTCAFQERFSSEFLNKFDCGLEDRHQRNWLARIVQAHQIQHPIRHLLLMRFLDVSADELFSMKVSPHRFGEGHWNCLNPICPKYHQPVIANVFLGMSRSGKRRAMGTFKCPDCGYTYCQTEPINSSDDFSTPKVIAYGYMWDTHFVKLWIDPQILLQDICSTLQIGYDTVHRQAKRLGLSEDRGNLILQTVPVPQFIPIIDEHQLQENRDKWTELLTANPDFSFEDFRNLVPTLCNDLLRFDALWLDEHKPARKTNPTRTVDWEERDEFLATQGPLLVRQIHEQQGKPVRVTFNSIAKVLGWGEGSIQRDKDKLPIAYPILLGLVESHEDFAIRRVWYTFNHHMAQGVPLNRSTLIKRAGLNKTVQTERVLSAVDEAIKSQSNAFTLSIPP